MGEETSEEFTVTNDGTGSADLAVLRALAARSEILRADGTTTTESELIGSRGAKVRRISGDFSPTVARRPRRREAEGRQAGEGRPRLPRRRPWTASPTCQPTSWTTPSTRSTASSTRWAASTATTSSRTATRTIRPRRRGRRSPTSPRRENPAGAFIDGKFILNGGRHRRHAARQHVVYDPASDTWTPAADAPVELPPAGRAVLDGTAVSRRRLSGCLRPCTDVAATTRPATLDSLADYPEATSHVACGGLDGQVICAGGTAQAASAHTYAYDPGSDTWSPRADVPTDVWGMASAAANGQLLLTGGIAADAITNEGWAYDPSTDSWTDLPASNNSTYRTGGGCGHYRIGGSVGLFAPIAPGGPPRLRGVRRRHGCSVG